MLKTFFLLQFLKPAALKFMLTITHKIHLKQSTIQTPYKQKSATTEKSANCAFAL